ncbi:MAG: hypothetical protein ABIH34_01845 [Nanoarchaeota archaeon]
MAKLAAEVTPLIAPQYIDQVDLDVISALLNLGYRRSEAEKAVTAARTEIEEEAELSELLRACLKRLQRA